MCIKVDVFSHKHVKTEIKETVDSFYNLIQWNTLVTHEIRVIKLLKSFNML